eukprot:ANDGO_00262.mRNA.1 Peroxyureidoacrylate/ureidoacrylate amidohydrolase RutB
MHVVWSGGSMGGPALLVIDMQNDFCHADGALCKTFPDIDTVIRNVARCVRHCRVAGLPVVWVVSEYDSVSSSIAKDAAVQKHVQRFKNGVPLKDEYLAGRYVSGNDASSPPCCAAGSWGAEIVSELQNMVQPHDAVVVKSWYSAFTETTLLDTLRKQSPSVTELVCCGVSTSTCVLATMLDAFEQGFRTSLLGDGTSASDEQRYDMACSWISHFSETVPTSRFCSGEFTNLY